jgi:EAL domain-containing protein (putative c-di-GMP-specific phosphodiesterase class I)
VPISDHEGRGSAWVAQPSHPEAAALIAAYLTAASARSERTAVVHVELLDPIGGLPASAALLSCAENVRRLLAGSGSVAIAGAAELIIQQALPGGVEDARHLARRLRALLDGPVVIDGTATLVQARIGIAIGPDDGTEPAELIARARLAAGHVQCDPRRRPQFYLPEMDDQRAREHWIIQELEGAMAQGALTVALQPQLDLVSARIDGSEALLRWHHPTAGWISPGEFIPAAERSGQIQRLGRWVLVEACRIGSRLTAAGWPLMIAVNLSADQVTFPELVEEVTDALHRSGLAARQLVLEVTESLLMRDEELAGRTLEALRRQGVQIALDDFGAGYAGLASLRHLPLDRLKIDRSLLADVGDRRGQALFRALVDVGHALDLAVVAEGVENQTQLSCARSARCDAVQGFVIGRPMGFASLCKFLRDRQITGSRFNNCQARSEQRSKAPRYPGKLEGSVDVHAG